MASTADGDREHVIFRQYLDAVGLQGLASAEAAGLHTSEWYALSLIAFHGALSSGELATRAGLTTGATTRLIDRLEKSGFARRTADPNDRRRVLVEPVPEALDRIQQVVGPARRHLAEVLDHYTPEQRALLFDYFARAAPAFRAATEEIRAHSAGSRRGRSRTSPA
ncbi:MarR family transcriptional regulator [Nocardia cyriacigeorgica]|jgi:DNA-binding MarR family transcriptional regulator|uniref:MarR family transcriptional regulator n=1 Tax=Nocardia cyriacigeorgica TaxID=135487 RepID=UPI0013D228DE|nr:MarR family transcriptional regulator [Nocardia cyriacigeorgica]MBF6435181.1 MarR family transcriptional regulator [Nocardia cyriacigeorgica]MBF6454753.1 MarR family transcriptional regulator [Nocardia cyriacigeorgica]MBF6477177.1 MarR family transcriptional regulator [Nocardia cyriacigeorgica]MBF6552647.1 MarR family transcriptional regulator [Nocardia cyriacigeorgica]NEW27060.1 MarR family transcriptional regulator [Nocardia cyriacigeorgica]